MAVSVAVSVPIPHLVMRSLKSSHQLTLVWIHAGMKTDVGKGVNQFVFCSWINKHSHYLLNHASRMNMILEARSNPREWSN